MKRFALILFVLLVVGCASQAQSPKRGADIPPPQPIATVCKEGSDRLSLAGVTLLEPADLILQKLGKADNIRHSAKYPMTTYDYGFGSITVWGDGRIFSLDLEAIPGIHPLGELWSGIEFGVTRETVMQGLAKMGYCPSTSSGNMVDFVRSEERLTLTFGGNDALEHAFLVLEKPPTELQSSTSSSPVGFYPSDVRTSTPEIDRVIQAAANKDGDTLAGLVKLTKEPCTAGGGDMSGGPICPSGTANGTPMEVFPSGSCELNFLPRELARDGVRSGFSKPHYVYALFRLGDEAGGHFGAEYGVILGTGEKGTGVTLYLDAQGAIVQVVSCGDAANMVPTGANFILPPKRAQLG